MVVELSAGAVVEAAVGVAAGVAAGVAVDIAGIDADADAVVVDRIVEVHHVDRDNAASVLR